jgi:hypothetical protein
MDSKENDAFNSSLFVAAGDMFTEPLPSSDRGIHFTEPLPSNDRRVTHADTQTEGKYL